MKNEVICLINPDELQKKILDFMNSGELAKLSKEYDLDFKSAMTGMAFASALQVRCRKYLSRN